MKFIYSFRALHRYRRGQGSNPGKPADFFRLSFRNCISCVNNCEDLLYIYYLFLFWTFIICSSTSFIDIFPRNMAATVRYLPCRGSQAAIMFLLSNICCVNSFTVSARYCWLSRLVNGAKPGMKKWRRGNGTMLTASFLRSAFSCGKNSDITTGLFYLQWKCFLLSTLTLTLTLPRVHISSWVVIHQGYSYLSLCVPLNLIGALIRGSIVHLVLVRTQFPTNQIFCSPLLPVEKRNRWSIGSTSGAFNAGQWRCVVPATILQKRVASIVSLQPQNSTPFLKT